MIEKLHCHCIDCKLLIKRPVTPADAQRKILLRITADVKKGHPQLSAVKITFPAVFRWLPALS